jgi:hypothetical protein
MLEKVGVDRMGGWTVFVLRIIPQDRNVFLILQAFDKKKSPCVRGRLEIIWNV